MVAVLTREIFMEASEKKKLGGFIVELGLLDNRDLGQALSIAQETSLPLGRVLVLSEMLSEEVLQGVLRCQSLIKQNLVDIELARKAMQMVSRDGVSVDDALFKLGWNHEATQDTTPLGELLIDAGYATREQLQAALEKSTTSGLPFGRLLVFSGVLTEGLLTGALNAQILIRDGKLSKSQAVEALKEAKNRQVTVEVHLKEKGFYDLPSRSCPRLGELLLFCGVISQSDLVGALEMGLMKKMPVGHILTSSNQVSARIMDAALQLQRLMSEQKVSITDARSVISSVKEGSSFEDALSQLYAEREDGQDSGSIPTNRAELADSDAISKVANEVGEVDALAAKRTATDNAKAAEIDSNAESNTDRNANDNGDVNLAVAANEGSEADATVTAAKALASVANASSSESSVGTQSVRGQKKFLSLFDFLKSLGRTDEEQVQEAFQVAMHNSDVLKQVLLIAGILDADTIERAERCRKLAQDKRLTLEHANIAFDYAERFAIDVPQALKELQWGRPEDDQIEFDSDDETAPVKKASDASSGDDTAASSKLETTKKFDSASTKKAAKSKSGSKGSDAGNNFATNAGTNAGTNTGENNNGAEAAAAQEVQISPQEEWEALHKRVQHLTLSGKLDKALDTRVRMLQLAEEKFPERVVAAIDEVAALYIQRLNLEQALQYYKKSLELRLSQSESSPTAVAEGYCNMGKVSYFMKDFANAEEYARKFIETIAGNLGKGHPDVACGWQNLANIFYAQKKYLQAQRAYQVGIHICEKGLGDSHPATVQMKRSYEILQNAMAEEEKAGLRDNINLGVITGSWRTLPRDSSQALFEV